MGKDKVRQKRIVIYKSGSNQISLTPKQIKLLDYLCSIGKKIIKMTKQEIADKVGISLRGYNYMIKDSNFIKAMQLNNLTEVTVYSNAILKTMIKDAVNDSKYMQQRTLMEINGMLPKEQPLVNILINQDSKPQEDIDKSIVKKILDTMPIDQVEESTDKNNNNNNDNNNK